MIDSAYLTEMQAAAKRAVSNNNARRKWGDSRCGSPVGVLSLVSEIVRLNRAMAEIVKATDSNVPDAAAANRASELARAAMTPGADVLLSDDSSQTAGERSDG